MHCLGFISAAPSEDIFLKHFPIGFYLKQTISSGVDYLGSWYFSRDLPMTIQVQFHQSSSFWEDVNFVKISCSICMSNLSKNGTSVNISTHVVEKCGYNGSVCVFYSYGIFIVTAVMLDVLQNHESINSLRMNQFNFDSNSPVISGNIFEKSLQRTDR